MKDYSQRTTDQLNEVREVLGKKYVSTRIENPLDFIRMATTGLDANVIDNFRSYFGLSLKATADMLNVSEPSIYRWIRSNKKLNRNLAVKLFEISQLFLLGIQIFGTQDKFFKWLNLPNAALGRMEPRELINIPEGISKIRDLLGRIEHGIYS